LRAFASAARRLKPVLSHTWRCASPTATGRDGKADVGFGHGTLLDPIPFGPDPDAVYEQSGWSYRVVEDGPELVLQTRGPSGWSDIYGFVPRSVPRIDIEVGNWWTCTNPRSPFVFGLIAAVNHDDGRREAISDWSGPLQVMTITSDGVSSSEEPRAVIPDKLKRFGLPGFQLDDDGRVRAA
jgi:arylamine N-acetyltransferase